MSRFLRFLEILWDDLWFRFALAILVILIKMSGMGGVP